MDKRRKRGRNNRKKDTNVPEMAPNDDMTLEQERFMIQQAIELMRKSCTYNRLHCNDSRELICNLNMQYIKALPGRLRSPVIPTHILQNFQMYSQNIRQIQSEVLGIIETIGRAHERRRQRGQCTSSSSVSYRDRSPYVLTEASSDSSDTSDFIESIRREIREPSSEEPGTSGISMLRDQHSGTGLNGKQSGQAETSENPFLPPEEDINMQTEASSEEHSEIEKEVTPRQEL